MKIKGINITGANYLSKVFSFCITKENTLRNRIYNKITTKTLDFLAPVLLKTIDERVCKECGGIHMIYHGEQIGDTMIRKGDCLNCGRKWLTVEVNKDINEIEKLKKQGITKIDVVSTIEFKKSKLK